MPNTEVKPASADGTWGESPWESRSPPDFSKLEEGPPWGAFFAFMGSLPHAPGTPCS
jgi:hypothetical protein